MPHPIAKNGYGQKTRRTPRILFTLFALVGLIYIALWALTGPVALYYIGDFYKQQGATINDEASISFNPFLTRLKIDNLVVTKAGQTPLKINSAIAELTLADLFSKKVNITTLVFNGIYVDAQQQPDGLAVAGVWLPTTNQPKAEPDKAPTEPLEWQVLIPGLRITDTHFSLVTENRQDKLDIDLFDLANLYFDQQQLRAELLLRAQINDTPAKLLLRTNITQPLAPEILSAKVEGSYDLGQIPFDKYTSLLPAEIETLIGKLSSAAEFDIAYTPEQVDINTDNFLLTLNDARLVRANDNAETLRTELNLSNLTVKVTDLDKPSPNIFVKTAPQLESTGLRLQQTNDATTTEEASTVRFDAQHLRLIPGEIHVELTQSSDESPQLTVTADRSSMILDGLNLDAAPLILTSASQTLQFESMALSKLDDVISFEITPSWSSESTQIFLHDDQNLVAAWDQASLPTGQVRFSGEPTLSFPEMTWKNLVVSKPLRQDDANPLATFAAFAIKQIGLQDNHLHIDQVLADDLMAEIILTPRREIQNLFAAQKGSSKGEKSGTDEKTNDTATTEDTQESGAKPFTFSVNELVISAGSRLKYVDRLLTPWYEYELLINTYQVGPIDSRYPDQETKVLLSAKAGEYSQYDINGYTKPLAEKVNLHLKGNFKEIHLPPQSFYIKDSLGYEIESGELDTLFDIAIIDNKLDGNAGVVMRSMELIPAGETETNSSSGGAITLNMALSMIKDGNGVIDVSVPMQGDLDNPQFGLGGFVAIILKQAMMEASKTFLMQSMVPYGGIASIAMAAGNEAFKLRFTPLPYSTGQTLPDEKQQVFLQQFAEVLKKNEQQIVRLCAITVPADLGAEFAKLTTLNELQTKQLIDLGYAREKALEKYLVEKGVKSSQLLECKPKIDKEAGSQPRIDLDT
jgi:hypothetical protein